MKKIWGGNQEMHLQCVCPHLHVFIGKWGFWGIGGDGSHKASTSLKALWRVA